jgi:hypothetical protein
VQSPLGGVNRHPESPRSLAVALRLRITSLPESRNQWMTLAYGKAVSYRTAQNRPYSHGHDPVTHLAGNAPSAHYPRNPGQRQTTSANNRLRAARSPGILLDVRWIRSTLGLDGTNEIYRAVLCTPRKVRACGSVSRDGGECHGREERKCRWSGAVLGEQPIRTGTGSERSPRRHAGRSRKLAFHGA